MRQKKKVSLVDGIGGWHVEFRTRNAPRRGEIYLPNCLPDKPFLAVSSENLAASDNFFMAAIPFQKPPGP